MLTRIPNGWAVVRNGVPLARYHGVGSKRRALARLNGVSPEPVESRRRYACRASC